MDPTIRLARFARRRREPSATRPSAARALATGTLTAIALLALAAASPCLADPPPLGPPLAFPGDAVTGLSVDTQEDASIAAGGPGYLVVWRDERTVLSGFTQTAYLPLMGNQSDIYAARLDADGNVLDTTPIIVTNQGRNQSRPRAAWNGENWLVVWTGERPDWYFFEDLLGARISPAGEVLDPEPIVIRPEFQSPANDRGANPGVGSDGTNWLVVWQDAVYEGGIPYPSIEGTRIAPDGTVLDPDWPVVRQTPYAAFGPRRPVVAFADGEYLVAWHEAGTAELRAQRLAPDMQLLGDLIELGFSSYRTAIDASDDTFFVLGGYTGYRIAVGGTVLDPGGITIPKTSYGFENGHPHVAWTGTSWATVHQGAQTQIFDDDSDLWLVRVAPDGSLIDPVPQLLRQQPDQEWSPVIAGDGAGGAQVAYVTRGISTIQEEDIRGARVGSDGQAGPIVDVSTGLPRQENLRFVTGNGTHLALYESRSSGVSRILVQRFDADGVAIDPEPTLVHEGDEGDRFHPSGAWNGTVYLVAWDSGNGPVEGKRLAADGSPIDPAPIPFLPSGGAPGVGALGDHFLVAANYAFSGDQSYLRGVRVSGADGSVLDPSPIQLGFDFALTPVVAGLGERWVVVWASKVRHDLEDADVYVRFVTADGTVGGAGLVSSNGEGWGPDIAVAGDLALVVYQDEVDGGDPGHIEGRLLDADGSFASGEFLVCEAANTQLFPAAAFDGEQFVATWVDYRTNLEIEQLRGDVWAARIDVAGTVIDPGGFQVTSGPLPEDLPDVAGMAGKTLLAYSRLHGVGGVPEGQRLAFRLMGGSTTGIGASPGTSAPGPVAVLGPNAPNPFNPSTTLSFALAEAGDVRLEVIDTAGRRVVTLTAGRYQAGEHRVRWDGRDTHGRRVASGVYIARLEAGSETVSRRMVLVK
jgi:hypothetical protein